VIVNGRRRRSWTSAKSAKSSLGSCAREIGIRVRGFRWIDSGGRARREHRSHRARGRVRGCRRRKIIDARPIRDRSMLTNRRKQRIEIGNGRCAFTRRRWLMVMLLLLLVLLLLVSRARRQTCVSTRRRRRRKTRVRWWNRLAETRGCLLRNGARRKDALWRLGHHRRAFRLRSLRRRNNINLWTCGTCGRSMLGRRWPCGIRWPSLSPWSHLIGRRWLGHLACDRGRRWRRISLCGRRRSTGRWRTGRGSILRKASHRRGHLIEQLARIEQRRSIHHARRVILGLERRRDRIGHLHVRRRLRCRHRANVEWTDRRGLYAANGSQRWTLRRGRRSRSRRAYEWIGIRV
jgi:hypothetical protein